MTGTTLSGLVEGRATGQVVAVVAGWPTVLLSNASDLHQTAGLRTEEMTAEIHGEMMLILTFHLRVLEPTEIEVDQLEATADGHALQ